MILIRGKYKLLGSRRSGSNLFYCVATTIIGRVLVLPPISLTVPGHSFKNDSIRFCWVLSEMS